MNFLKLATTILIAFAVTAKAGELDRITTPPSGWPGRVFEPSFDFPMSPPTDTAQPWRAIDYILDPEAYMAVVLAYVLEGQDRSSWRLQDNQVRRWYHAPWMGPGAMGREFVNGLTRERSSQIGELGPGQVRCVQNWAVGFYNAEAAAVFGRIWSPVRNDTGRPDLSALPFPVGSVAAKLLFTEATAGEVPLLAGSPEVQAFIHTRPAGASPIECPPQDVLRPGADPNARPRPVVVDEHGIPISPPRELGTVRLLQLDIAVRDDRANGTTGWVFGTFMFDGRIYDRDPWRKIRPVGLVWGNDPDYDDTVAATGIQRPRQGHLISDFGLGRPFGRGGRMNGPVDSSISSCLSCHMTAQWPANLAALTPARPANRPPQAPQAMWDNARCWFRNLGPTEPFGRAPIPATGSSSGVGCGTMPPDRGVVSLDFSLQLAVGLRNWDAIHGSGSAPRFVPFGLSTTGSAMYESMSTTFPEISRAGDD